ncbi:MAG: hypothetical protein GX202_00785 [Firmicutes bacterium]|nr:hypothetical protein [Bacillota bacterium]
MIARYKLLSLFLAFSLQGCNIWDYLNIPERQPTVPQGNRNEARELLHSFMNARLADENEDKLRAYLTDEAWNDFQSADLTLRAEANQEFVGYKIMEESDLSEGRYAFTTSLQLLDRSRPYGANLTEDLIVSFNADEYRISSVRLLNTVEVQGVGTDLIWVGREKEETKEVGLYNLQAFPPRLTPLGGTAELEAGRAGYAAVVLNPENRRVAFGTTGTHGALAVLKWDGATPDPEQVTLEPLDVFYGQHTILQAFSPDTRYLAVEIRSTAGTDRVEVYQVDEKNRLNFHFEQAFPVGEYNVSFRQWEPDSKAFLIRVGPGVQATGDEEKMGTWRINVQTGEREKVVGG